MKAKIKAWLIAINAIIIAIIAFPAIAGIAIASKDAMAWQNKAEAYIAMTTPNLEKSTIEKAVPLANRFLLSSEYSSTLSDERLITSLIGSSRPDMTEASQFMSQHQCLSEAIYYEARSETLSGQKAVGEVILNRVSSKHFPSTICEVVYEGSERRTGCQFTFTCDGSLAIQANGKAWDRAQNVARLIMTEDFMPVTDRATHYHTLAVSPIWSETMRMTKQVGSHVFYRFAPRNYKPSTALQTVAPPI